MGPIRLDRSDIDASVKGRRPREGLRAVRQVPTVVLTRDGTAEPVSRDQILRCERGQGNTHFPRSVDHEQDWQPYPVDPYSAICDDHTIPRGRSRNISERLLVNRCRDAARFRKSLETFRACTCRERGAIVYLLCLYMLSTEVDQCTSRAGALVSARRRTREESADFLGPSVPVKPLKTSRGCAYTSPFGCTSAST